MESELFSIFYFFMFKCTFVLHNCPAAVIFYSVPLNASPTIQLFFIHFPSFFNPNEPFFISQIGNHIFAWIIFVFIFTFTPFVHLCLYKCSLSISRNIKGGKNMCGVWGIVWKTMERRRCGRSAA